MESSAALAGVGRRQRWGREKGAGAESQQRGGGGASSKGAGDPDLPLEPALQLLPGAGDYAGEIRAPEWKGDWDLSDER